MHKTLVMVALGFVWLACTGVAQADENPPDTISVTGTAVTHVAPDEISWTITLVDENKGIEQAVQSSEEKLANVLGLADELDVAKEDVQTGRLSIRREYHRDQHGNQGSFKHYAVRRTVTLRQKDLSQFQEFLTNLVARADVEVDYSLKTSKLHDLRWETRLEALRIAKKKAEALAEVVGERLGGVLRIDENPQQGRMLTPQVSNVAFGAGFGLGGGGADAHPDAVEGTFAPGTIEVKESVAVVFKIARAVRPESARPVSNRPSGGEPSSSEGE